MQYFQKINRIYQTGGFLSLCSRLLSRMERFASVDCVDVFITDKRSSDLTTLVNSKSDDGISFSRITKEGMTKRCPYGPDDDRQAYLESVSKRVKRGEIPFVAEYRNLIVAHAWVSKSDDVHITEIDHTIHLEPETGNVVIKNCWTHPAHRRKGLYTGLLSYIDGQYCQNRKVICCRRSNKPSRAGIVKVFQPYKRVYRVKLFHFNYCWERMLTAPNNRLCQG